ncbi:MAG: hypothetical protein AAF830_15520 [Pseudomonadota bacterium]
MWLRVALFIGSAATAAVTLGRKQLNARIDDEVSRIVDKAAIRARAAIKSQSHGFLADWLRNMVRNIGFKALVMSAIVGGRLASFYPDQVFLALMGCFVVAFTVRDAINAWPLASIGFTKLRSSGWQVKRAFTETIAVQVFDEAFAEVSQTEIGHVEKLLLTAAGRKERALKEDISTKIAAIVSEASWSDIRPFAIYSLFSAAALIALYSFFAFVAVQIALPQ